MNASRRELLAGAAAAGALAAAPAAFASENPWGLGVENAPVEGYAPATMRLVEGRAPRGLAGSLYRNGPGWFRYPSSSTGHWFDGDGFIQRFAIEDGRVRHSGKFADTLKRRVEMQRQEIIFPGFGTRGQPRAPVESPDDINAANTSVMMAGGELWALWEGGSPTRMNPDTLETIGIRPFRQDLASMPFTAHPKVEPNGRIWNIGAYGPRVIIWRLAADGTLEDAQVIDIGQASYLHDWAVTERYLIIPLQPWVHDRMTAPMVDGYTWHGDRPFRILVLDKNDYSNRRTYELPAMFYFHTGDAWEDTDGTIRFDLCASANAHFVTEAFNQALEEHRAAPPPPSLTRRFLKKFGL